MFIDLTRGKYSLSGCRGGEPVVKSCFITSINSSRNDFLRFNNLSCSKHQQYTRPPQAFLEIILTDYRKSGHYAGSQSREAFNSQSKPWTSPAPASPLLQLQPAEGRPRAPRAVVRGPTAPGTAVTRTRDAGQGSASAPGAAAALLCLHLQPWGAQQCPPCCHLTWGCWVSPVPPPTRSLCQKACRIRCSFQAQTT